VASVRRIFSIRGASRSGSATRTPKLTDQAGSSEIVSFEKGHLAQFRQRDETLPRVVEGVVPPRTRVEMIGARHDAQRRLDLHPEHAPRNAAFLGR
jgi:hypothetical protein